MQIYKVYETTMLMQYNVCPANFPNIRHFNKYSLEKMAGWRAKAKGDKDEFAGYAIRFVQNEIRYLGLEIGPNTHQPHSPAQVCKARYGDCKDKALLLAAILQKENIPAYVALVNTTDRDKTSEVLPSPGAFDHAIVAIERSSNFIFIDATSTNQEGPLANMYVPAYGKALLVKAGEDSLRTIEPGMPLTTYVEETLNARYNETGVSTLEVSTRLTGGTADDMRGTLAESSIADIEKDYVQYYQKVYEGVKQAHDITVKDDSLRNEMVLKEKYTINELWQEKESVSAMGVYAQLIAQKLPDPAEAYKDAPIAIPDRVDMNYTMHLHMPDNWSLDFNDMEIRNNSYGFNFESSVDKSDITLKYRFRTFKDHIPENELAAYKRDYKRMMKVLSFSLTIDRNGKLANSRDNSSPMTAKDRWRTALYIFLALSVLFFIYKRQDRIFR